MAEWFNDNGEGFLTGFMIGGIIAILFTVYELSYKHKQELLKAKQVTKMEVTCRDIRNACIKIKCINAK